jgi:putative ABC transport system permease protein
MFTLTIKNLLAHKMRLVSTALAVLLGVAFMAGTLVFTDTLTATFDSVLSEANQGVDALVRAPSDVELSYGQSGERIDATHADLIRGVDGVADVATQINGYAQLVGPDGRPVGDQANAPAFGMNWVDNADLNPYLLSEGHAPASNDQIVIDKASAAATGYRPGDVATVLTPAAPADFTIAGVATFGTADSPAGATVVLFSDATAEALLAGPGQVDGIAVTARDGISQAELTASISAALPDDLEVITGAEVIAEDQAAFDEAFGPFKVFMLVFAFVAVFVGAFIINNTFSITVAQRSREMAMLRAVGASRRQVLRSVVIEATITGVVASGIGVTAGIAVATGIRTLILGAGVALPDGPIVVSANSMLVAFAVGIIVTIMSAVLPARRAGRTRPIAALRDVAVDQTARSARRAIAGASIVTIGIGVLLVGLGGAGIAAVGLGALVTLIGIAVLGPIVARPAARVLGSPLRASGVAGQIATGNAMRSPQRTARTASALMIGVALVAFIAVFSSSAKSSLAGSLDDTFTGTHVIDSGVFDSRGGLSPELAGTLTTTPGIDAVSESRNVPAAIDGGGTGVLQAFTASTIGDVFRLGEITGDLTDLGLNGIAVDANAAADRGWTLGSTVPITFPSGTVDFTVAATYDNGAEWVGTWFVDIAAIDAHLPGSLDSRIYLSGDEAAINAVAATYPTADVLDADAFFDQTTSEIDQILGIIYAMLALAIVIALLGVANTLSLSIFERTREIGLLRAVGMTRRQLRSTIRGEAAIIAVFGTLGGIGIGTFFGWATVRALASEGIDTFTLPTTTLTALTVIAAVAGALAATLPARRAARLEVLAALAAS